MTITLLYATYSNSTALASEDLKAELEKLGHSVQLEQISEVSVEAVEKAEVLVLASPSWDYNGQQGMPHEDFLNFHEAHPNLKLTDTPLAIMGLGDSSFTFYCGAVDHLWAWFGKEGGAKQLIDPLKIDQYYVNEDEAKVSIAAWAQQLDSALKQTPI